MAVEVSPISSIRRLAGRLAAVAKRRADGPIWDGVYTHFCDVPVEDDAYATPAHLDAVEQTATAYLSAWRAGESLRLWHDGLALLTGCVAKERQEIVVVDFGGGLGTGYLQLKQCMPPHIRIRYVIIEIPDLVARGRRLFAEIDDVSFCESLASVQHQPDIVYVNSALQYVENYASILGEMAGLQPNWIFLERTAAGDVPSFLTRQLNVKGKSMRYWFLNRRELINILDGNGYRLAYEAEVGPIYDQQNLPPTHRIARMRDFLFCGA